MKILASTFAPVNRLLSIFLILSIFYQGVVNLGIEIWYQANKSYVASVLCENKNKPEMKCCGKCFVRKQMKKTDTEESGGKQSLVKQLKAEWFAIVPEKSSSAFDFDFIDASLMADRYKMPKTAAPSSSIFHPPPFCRFS